MTNHLVCKDDSSDSWIIEHFFSSAKSFVAGYVYGIPEA
jgi:hypothetical protein